jgi:6-phosphogluconolactonase
MFTRRKFLFLLPGFAATAHAQHFFPFRRKPVVPDPPVFVYFGTDTDKGLSKGIYQSRFDAKKGELTPPTLAAATAVPSFMALSPVRNGRRFLYAVNETNDASAGVTSFALDPRTGSLRELNHVPAVSPGPCYISVDGTGHSAYIASYAGSGVTSYRIEGDGTLSQPVDHFDFKESRFGKHGPNAARQDASHPHSATISPDGRFLLVNDLGNDDIVVFVMDGQTAKLTSPHLFSNDRPGSGPRHIAFHPNGRWAYGINELDSTLDHYLWTTTRTTDTPQGLLINTNTPVKTTAADFTGTNTAAEVAISADGAYLYASNRGEDSLVVFAIKPKDGSLSFVQRISCGGKIPRQFTLDPSGNWLVCANQGSASVTVFRREVPTGKLEGPVQTLPLDSPQFALFATS